MTTLGQQWRHQVPKDEANYQILVDSITQREREAETWISQVKAADLEAGIASCINRGSDSLGLPMPPEIVATAAMRGFVAWLSGQGLIADFAADTEDAGAALLLVTPA